MSTASESIKEKQLSLCTIRINRLID